jgi:hypothetical protein
VVSIVLDLSQLHGLPILRANRWVGPAAIKGLRFLKLNYVRLFVKILVYGALRKNVWKRFQQVQ